MEERNDTPTDTAAWLTELAAGGESGWRQIQQMNLPAGVIQLLQRVAAIDGEVRHLDRLAARLEAEDQQLYELLTHQLALLQHGQIEAAMHQTS